MMCTPPLAVSCVVLPLVNVNGQLSEPWVTVPCTFQPSVEPETVPLPVPFTWMFPAQVALNDTLADVLVTGVTVYFKPPQLVAGNVVPEVTHVPAKSPSDAVAAPGEVGFLPVSLSS